MTLSLYRGKESYNHICFSSFVLLYPLNGQVFWPNTDGWAGSLTLPPSPPKIFETVKNEHMSFGMQLMLGPLIDHFANPYFC